MRTTNFRFKGRLLKISASMLFYSRVLKLFNLFVNRFQPKCYREGNIAFPFIINRYSRNIQILLYHRVNDEFDPFFPATPTYIFAKQMEFLSSQFNICSLEDIIEIMRRNDIPDNTIAITFDDGYRDNYLNAFPILKKLSIPATIFLATDAIDSGRILWHDQVFSAFRETREPFLAKFGNNSMTYPIRTLSEKLIAQTKALNFLRSLDESEKSIWIKYLLKQLKVEHVKYKSNLMLTWDEVKIMHQNGIAFGSHTASHPILSKISIDQASKEVIDSKRTIEAHIGIPVKTFAYPNGRKEDFTTVTKKILKKAGYLCALTTIFGCNELGHDLFELYRGKPWEDHLPSFATKLNWYKFSAIS